MSWFSNLWTKIETDAEDFFQAEVTALKPVAATAVSTLATEELADLTTPGGTANTGKTLAKVVSATVQAAETAGITAAAPSIIAAIGQALPEVTAGKTS